MRILVPTADYPPIEGGISTVALHLSRELAAMGHEVTVVAPWFPGMREFDTAEPVRVVRFPGYRLGWLRVLPMGWRIWPLLRDTELILAINVSHSGLIARWAKKRYVTFAYAYEFMRFANLPPLAMLLRQIYGRAAITVAISHFTRRALEEFGVAAEKIVTLFPGTLPPMPVSSEDARSVRSRLGLGDAPFVLAVGRFVPRKGQIVLVRAMPEILERHPEVHLVMAGRGPCLSECERKIAALGLDARVHCPGYVDEATLAALYHECTLFALPTGESEGGHVEGFGLVFAEAHRYGKPVVAGRSGGVEDAVRHEETGLIVESGNPREAARAILELLDNPEKAQRLGQAGRERARREFDWRVFAEKILEYARDMNLGP